MGGPKFAGPTHTTYVSQAREKFSGEGAQYGSRADPIRGEVEMREPNHRTQAWGLALASASPASWGVIRVRGRNA